MFTTKLRRQFNGIEVHELINHYPMFGYQMFLNWRIMI